MVQFRLLYNFNIITLDSSDSSSSSSSSNIITKYNIKVVPTATIYFCKGFLNCNICNYREVLNDKHKIIINLFRCLFRR